MWLPACLSMLWLHVTQHHAELRVTSVVTVVGMDRDSKAPLLPIPRNTLWGAAGSTRCTSPFQIFVLEFSARCISSFPTLWRTLGAVQRINKEGINLCITLYNTYVTVFVTLHSDLKLTVQLNKQLYYTVFLGCYSLDAWRSIHPVIRHLPFSLALLSSLCYPPAPHSLTERNTKCQNLSWP